MIEHLTAILALYPAIARPLSAPEPLGNAGGSSGARLWRFASGLGPLVLRAWPSDGPPARHIEQIHGWLAESARLGFVPAPLRTLGGATLVQHSGRLWELAPWMPGAADLRRPPAPARLRAGFAALAAFHQSLAHHRMRGGSPGLARRAREIDDLMLDGFLALEEAVNRQAADPRAPLARRWLALAKPLAHPVAARVAAALNQVVVQQPCLRDVRPHHLLFDGDRITGLVDFGAMDVDTVAADLARLLLEWVGPDRAARAQALGSYAAIRPLDDVETALVEAFEASAALLTGGHWLRWHFVEGRSFDGPSAVTEGLHRGLDRLTELSQKLGPDAFKSDLARDPGHENC
jgi:Ser/Thr protein kinase RdoA (MazF antagonist)